MTHRLIFPSAGLEAVYLEFVLPRFPAHQAQFWQNVVTEVNLRNKGISFESTLRPPSWNFDIASLVQSEFFIHKMRCVFVNAQFNIAIPFGISAYFAPHNDLCELRSTKDVRAETHCTDPMLSNKRSKLQNKLRLYSREDVKRDIMILDGLFFSINFGKL